MRNFHKRHALMTVSDWPAYLLRGIPSHLREDMTARAAYDDVSLADVVRQALCHHYELDCDPASFGYQAELDTSSDMLLVRLQPDLWKLMQKETRRKYGATKTLILESLTDYLEAT